MLFKRLPRISRVLVSGLFVAGCGVAQEVPNKSAPAGLITTPAFYYSSPKAKYLGANYKDNLDRLAERIVRHTKTANLQFANNIASVGGIGFFTHSATKIPDERFLEVILAAPDSFETKGDYSGKVVRLFGIYGADLLSILSSDSAIYEQKDVSGYGLNLTWRRVDRDPSTGSRVTLERGVIYLQKERVRAFLRHELSQNQLISDAVIFAGQEGGPITLVSYQPQITQPDFRPPLQDETIAGGKPEAIPYRSESQNQQPRVARLDGVNKQSMAPPVEKKAPSVPASQLETENKSAWSKRALAHDSQPAVVQAKPVAKTSAEAEKAPGVRPQPPAREAGARIGSPATTVPETKSVAGQITVANKPVPEAQAKKTEPSTMSSKKSPAEAKAMRSPATAQREKAFGMNKNQESATSGIQQVEGAPSNSDKKIEALGKITLSDAARPKSQPVAVNAGSEQIALVRKQTGETAATVKPSQARKTLEGYVIQAVFEHKADAQRWAEKIERRGYTVSLTETGGASVRLRVGSFALREEADRQLRALKQEGLTGIILNLPQPYRSGGGVAAAAEAAKATPIQE